MARKRHTAEEIVTKLRQIDVLVSQGRPIAEAVRTIGVTEVTYYRWRSEYGGLKGDQVKRLLETENKQLRRAVSDFDARKADPQRGRLGPLFHVFLSCRRRLNAARGIARKSPVEERLRWIIQRRLGDLYTRCPPLERTGSRR
jgi:putative transposase